MWYSNSVCPELAFGAPGRKNFNQRFDDFPHPLNFFPTCLGCTRHLTHRFCVANISILTRVRDKHRKTQLFFQRKFQCFRREQFSILFALCFIISLLLSSTT